jgi:hypothetical protein
VYCRRIEFAGYQKRIPIDERYRKEKVTAVEFLVFNGPPSVEIKYSIINERKLL